MTSLPDDRREAFRLALYGIQVGLAVGLLSLAIFGTESRTFYGYYGVAIGLVPALVDYATGGRFSDLHRSYLVTGLSLHPLGFALGIYYSMRWWDVLTHFVSGTMLAVSIYAVAVSARRNWELPRLDGWRLHAAVFALMLSFGLIWELYEVAHVDFHLYAPVDTATDLVMDVTGWAVVASVYPRLLGELPEGIAPRLERASRVVTDRTHPNR